jgi:acyl dehydratase
MDVKEVDAPPNLGVLYAKAALAGLVSGGDGLPGTELVVPEVTVSRDHLTAYDRVCGFAVNDRLPAPYLHVLTFPLSVELMASRSFPFPLPGLVHIANTITQHRPLTADEPIELRVRTADLQPHEKGRQFDVVAEARVGDECAWTGRSTYLRREGNGGDAPASPSDRPDPPAPSAVWRVPGDTGRRYAAVSGDRNPIHLHPLTARLFGFPRPIAHGMWTKARCLAALHPRLPDAFRVDAEFKAPLMLPAKVAFSSQHTDAGWRFGVHDAKKGKPHIEGTVDAE